MDSPNRSWIQRIHYLFATQIVIGGEFLKMIMEVNKNSRKRYWKKIASSKRIKCIRIAYYEWTFSFSSSLPVSQINYDFTLNSISFSQIQYKFTRKIYSWWNFRSTIFFANSQLIRDNTMDPLSFPRTHHESTINFANPLWFNYLFREFTIQSRLDDWSTSFRKSTIYFANPLWIHYLFPLCFANQLAFANPL